LQLTEMGLQDFRDLALNLHWLAFLLTGRRDLSVDIATDASASRYEASPYFVNWMHSWSRRLVIAQALTAIRVELAESARRTELAPLEHRQGSREALLDGFTTKQQIEDALLAIDAFPRAAVLLLIFEGLPMPDVLVLLDAGETLVRKALAIGIRELTGHSLSYAMHSFSLTTQWESVR